MVSLMEIENKLNLIIGDRDIQAGMCKPMKNRYYIINDEYGNAQAVPRHLLCFSLSAYASFVCLSLCASLLCCRSS